MKIVVCLKPVPDTGAVSLIDPEKKRLVRNAEAAIMNPFDEFALEAALRLRDADASHTVTVLALAPPGSKETLRKALAMGADDAVHVHDPGFAGSDGAKTARVLHAALTRIGYDAVLCGTQSADGAGGYIPTMLAELLDLPAMTNLRSLRFDDGHFRGERSVDGTSAELACEAPVLASITKEFAAPRYASLKGIMAAKKKEIFQLTEFDLACGELQPYSEVLTVALPQAKAAARVVDGGDPARAADEIVRFLEERHLL